MNQARKFEADSVFVVPRAENAQKCQKQNKQRNPNIFLFFEGVLVLVFFDLLNDKNNWACYQHPELSDYQSWQNRTGDSMFVGLGD